MFRMFCVPVSVLAFCVSAAAAPTWRPVHAVMVVLENLSAFEATPAQRSEGNAPVYGQSN